MRSFLSFTYFITVLDTAGTVPGEDVAPDIDDVLIPYMNFVKSLLFRVFVRLT